jgi:ubiquinone biosynthesis protein COQ9
MRPPNLCKGIRRPICLRSNLGARRTYYSDYHPEPTPFPDAQEKILDAAMRHVPLQGFTSKALTEGAKDSGYLEVSVQLFPRGVFDLINYHLVTQRLALRDRVQFPGDLKLDMGQKVRILILDRLRANEKTIHKWQDVSLQNNLVITSCR